MQNNIINTNNVNVKNHLLNNEITKQYVIDNFQSIKNYFVQDIKEIRSEFIKHSTIQILNYDTEIIKFNNQDFSLVDNNNIVKNITGETLFLTNIIKTCLYCLEITIENQSDKEDIIENAITDMITTFDISNHNKEYKYFAVVLTYMSGFMINNKITHDVNKTHLYYINKDQNRSYIESLKSSDSIEVKTNATYIILEDQLMNYIYMLINLMFFIKKQNETIDPQTIIVNTQINIHEIKETQKNNIQLIIYLSATLCVSISIRYAIEGFNLSDKPIIQKYHIK